MDARGGESGTWLGTGLPTAAVVPGAPIFAALDLGTNNCRLLVAQGIEESYRVIDAFSRIVRLGEGLSRNDQLSGAAMARTLAALRVCGAKMRRRGVTTVRAVATEACRRASNCDEFLAIVWRETGIDVETISSAEEGRLALAGCAALLDPQVPLALVFDIGGGSTELMWLETCDGQPRLLDQISIRQGVIGLAERHGGDRVSPAAYQAMIAEIADAIAAFTERNGITAAVRAEQVQVLGASGTVTTLAGIHLRLARYDRSLVDGTYLTMEAARGVIAWLLTQDFHGRAAHPCIGPDRADLVVAGCAVLEAIWQVVPAPTLRIADRGLREGILAELIAETRAEAGPWSGESGR
ncbi:exopolyphosphatase / guanosine-5'-triphosphate,3'-diphosphate pyrophosphatase [uncultured Gammaproteobacteria bacterium]